MADKYVGLSDAERLRRLDNIAASNKSKRDEAEALAKRHQALDTLEFNKQQDEAARRAQDFARDQLVKSLIAKGTNSIDALWEAGKSIPFSTPSVALAVETAHSKANTESPRLGAATMDLGGNTIYGQTNNAGRFFPINAPRPPKDGEVKLQVAENGNAEDFINSPAVASTNVLKTLPDNLRTNQFNTASMASIAPRPASTVSTGSPPPDNSQSFFGSALQNPPQPSAVAQPDLPAPVDMSNSLPQEVSRLTTDGRLAIFDARTKQFLRYANSPTSNIGSQ